MDTFQVTTTLSAKKVLSETLKNLSSEELDKFKSLIKLEKDFPPISRRQSTQDIVERMVETYSQDCVELTIKVLKEMKRNDLVQTLSDLSPGIKEKLSVDEHQPSLIQRVETMVSVIELLLETLADLSDGEFAQFRDSLHQIDLHRHFSDIPWRWLMMGDRQYTVFLMVQHFGQQSVENAKEVLKRMKRNDLVQRLSDSSSRPKKKHSRDECPSALMHKMATMASVIELLLETLADLSNGEFEWFRDFLPQTDFHRHLDMPWRKVMMGDRLDTVFLVVQHYGQLSVEKTKEVLKRMKRTDLVQRLSDSSTEPKKKHSDEHGSDVIQRAAVKQILLETLKDLSHMELQKFMWLLQFTYFQKSLPQIPWDKLALAYEADDLVDLLVENQQSLEVTKEVFMDMNRTDLVQRLSETSTGHKEKHRSERFHKEVTMTPLQEKLLETLEDLSYGELEQFKLFLQLKHTEEGLPGIPRHQKEMADRDEIAKLMVEIYGLLSVEVTREFLKKMNRNDLVRKLSDINSGSKGPSTSLELGDGGSIMQYSTDWTKLVPEVNITGAEDEGPTYSLHSEGGSHFECSVSGLRWACKERVSFKYQFCSWEEHMERMESIKYMPAGPLMDITVIAGKFDDVYLPHWICIDENPKISDKFAVLHINDCGDVVEKVSEVTSSHVKLSEPVFSPRAVLMKAGFSVKINCNVLIYQTNTAFLTLHVYLIPCDPGLQQAMDKRELSYGYKVIRKPHPEKSLKMHDRFVLTADLDGAEIYPEKLKLRYESRGPNFFEVFIEKPERNFTLKLTQENEKQPVWTCVLRKDEYQSTGPIQGEHFVDKHQCELIARVSNIGPILDNLLAEGVIQQEVYDTISAIQTTQEQMRKLYSGPLSAGGHAAKDIFYKLLEEKESYLVADLKSKES